jgi:polyisoprenoid-binding protein YceI
VKALLLAASLGAALLGGCGSKADSAAATVSEPAADAAPAAPLASAETELAVAPPEKEVVAASTGEPSTRSNWTVDKAKSRIEFTGSQTGKDFTGAFADYEAAITLDPADLASAHIKVTIDMASAETGDRQRDDALPSSDWFSVKDFPTAVFDATDIRAAGAGYAAHGKLTIRGVSKDLILPFSLAIAGDRASADGEVSLLRTDFGVGQGDFSTSEWVGLDVKVAIHIAAAR